MLPSLRRFLLALAMATLLGGCLAPRTPEGYEADTTPTHDGEEWVGGPPR